MAMAMGTTTLTKASNYHPLAMNKHAASTSTLKQSNRRSFFTVEASSPSAKSVGSINGNKVNGIAMGETPLLHRRRSSGEILGGASDADDDDVHECLLGKFVEKCFVYRQSFIIRSYETGPDGTATMETLMNLLQVIHT